MPRWLDFKLKRRAAGVCSASTLILTLLLLAAAARADVTTFDQLNARAVELAATPYAPLETQLPAQLTQLDYDSYRKIEIIPHRGLWWDDPAQPFRIQFFHRGYIYPHRVDIHIIDHGRSTLAPFDPDYFNYHGHRPDNLDQVHGFAGFRVLYPLNRPDKYDELISFLGASYFRAVPPGGVYGASARGLAIDIGLFDRHEEFPRFRAFWLIHPAPGSKSFTVLALLDSPAVTGAYEFTITPPPGSKNAGNITSGGGGGGTASGGKTSGGATSGVRVRATLHFRHGVTKLGLAPLTSMFFYGPDDRGAGVPRDHRPRVHDSDQLIVQNAGVTIVHQLERVAQPRTLRFPASSLVAFGLRQSDRNPEHYRDREAHSELRPDVMVHVNRPWGPGHIELLELPAPHEGVDNIGAYFVPDQPVQAGDVIELDYSLSFSLPAPAPGSAPGSSRTQEVDRD